MLFYYKSLTKEGEVVEETVESTSKEELYAQIKDRGETLVSVEEKKQVAFFKKDLSFLGRIKEEDIILLARNLSSMISAGLPVARALQVIERQSKKKKMKDMMQVIGTTIKEGQTLSAGLEKFPRTFSDLFVAMVRAGEESGNLAESLGVVASQMESAYKLKKKVRGAMLYPGIILSVMVIIGILMLMFVVPTLTATFADLNVDLPASTRAIIAVSDFLKNHTVVALGLMVAVVAGCVLALRSKQGKAVFDKVVLKIPIIGNLVKEVNAARTSKTLASLLTAGVDVVHAIEITKDVIQNGEYKVVLEDMKGRIEKGGVMSEVFRENEHLYPAFVGEMTAVGEETGKLTELLERVAVFYEEDVEQRTKDMSTIIEPFLMVIIGGVVGFFAISMISPMYSLSSAI